MKIKNKKQLIIMSVFISIAILLVVGFSYAYFSFNIMGNETNLITAGCFKLSMRESGALSLTNSYPITDNMGLNTNPYIVTIENQCTISARYNTTFNILNTSTIGNESKVKIAMNGDDNFAPIMINALETITLNETPQNTTASYLLDSGYLEPGETRTFYIRMWIDYDVTDFNGSFDGKVILEAIAATNPASNLDTSKAIKPRLAFNMIPVYYDSTNNVWRKADSTNADASYQWYDYNNKMWANAVTVKDYSLATSLVLEDNTLNECVNSKCNRNDYVTAELGTVIPMSDINTMWVWIPRFNATAPSNYNGGTNVSPGAINVKFATRNGAALDAFWWDNNDDGIVSDDEQLGGFWYGKFETTGALATACANESCDISSLTILPDQTALILQTTASFFYAGRSLEKAGNPYGFSSNEIETHLSKNNEWGAVTYLTQSIYGRCSNATTCEEVSSNLVSVQVQNVSSTITGCAANSAVGVLNNQCPSGYAYNETNNNGISSTTGNVYGIYDMHGGNAEYVVGNFNNTTGSSNLNISSIESKYKNTYTGVSYNGHALTETSGWYSDEATFIDATSPWLTRGGFYASTGDESGIFNFNSSTGDAGVYSSRMAIITDELIISDKAKPQCTWVSSASPLFIGRDQTTNYILNCIDSSSFEDSIIVDNDFIVNGTSISVDSVLKSPLENGYSYTIAVSGISNGTSSISLKAGSVSDAFGNKNVATSASSIVSVDVDNPICTWTDSPTYVKSNENIIKTLTCTDANGINDSDIVASDFMIVGNQSSIAITNIQKVAISNGYTYTITITSSAIEGSSSLKLKPSSINDQAGNSNGLSEASSVVIVDVTPPICTWSGGNIYVKSGTTNNIVLTCTDNNGITQGSYIADDLNSALTKTADLTTTTTSTGNSTSYVYTVSSTINNNGYGLKEVTLPANTLMDAAGNGNVLVSETLNGVYANFSTATQTVYGHDGTTFRWIYDYKSYVVAPDGLTTVTFNGAIYTTTAYIGYNYYWYTCLTTNLTGAANSGTTDDRDCAAADCARPRSLIRYGTVNPGGSYDNRYWYGSASGTSGSSTTKPTHLLTHTIDAASLNSGGTQYATCAHIETNTSGTAYTSRRAKSAVHITIYK